MMKNLKLIFGALSALTFAGALDAAQEHIVSMPMHQYKSDCGTKSRLRLAPGAASLLQDENVPGAGIDAFEPFQTVLKDGFLAVDCVKDYMYDHGDKFGDNRHSYKLGPVSNVSIVHYDAVVAKEDQAEMTQKVCFEFCRTVPNMGFFGIVNGRGCYCTPYFTPMASDSSDCDAVCEGDNTLMCGGKSKSSVFAMHMCDSTKDDLGARSDTATSLKASMDRKVGHAKELSDWIQDSSVQAQKSFGAVGDSSATGLAQAGKVWAGKLVHKAEDGEKVTAKLGSLAKSAAGLKDFTDPATVTEAERIMEDMDQTIAEGEALSDELDKMIDLADHPKVADGAANQYYPVMYFVDKEFDSVPSTCSGDIVGEVMVGSEDSCASACDSHIHSCVGYQFFEMADGHSGCALLSNFKTGSYYTACGTEEKTEGEVALDFLQSKKKRKEAPFMAQCFAKLSKFEGTSLKPNPSGKCKQCFKELTKADRCY